MHVSDLTDGSFVSTRPLTALNVPMVASRAGVGTIRNPPPATRVMLVMLGVTTTLMLGTTTGVVDTGVDTTAGTTTAQVVPLATARGVMAAVATVC